MYAAAIQDGFNPSSASKLAISSRNFTSPESYLSFERLFPSLKLFAGQVLDCAPVVKSSKLARQLVELEVRTGSGLSTAYSYGIESLAQAVSPLPKLGRFEHSGYYNKYFASTWDEGYLAQIVAAYPELNFLKLPSALIKLIRPRSVSGL